MLFLKRFSGANNPRIINAKINIVRTSKWRLRLSDCNVSALYIPAVAPVVAHLMIKTRTLDANKF